MSYTVDQSPTLVEELTRGVPQPTLEEVEAAKKELHERYSEDELLQLKSLADKLRTPMNRRARRALQARMRKYQ
jgi:hypothetical protein